ncbi:MAG: hypothetical protein ABSH16_00705 [Sedimentisphaerales bacterium]
MKKILFLSTMVFFGFAGYAFSEEPATVVSAELRQVSLFKNGLGFFISEVTIPDKVKSFSIVPEAAVSHGTFWVSYPPKVTVESVIARQVEGKEQVEATTIADLLKANLGKKVKIYFADKNDSAIDAKLLNVTEEQRKTPPNPYEPGRIIVEENPYYYGIRNMVFLDTDQGQIAVSADRIVRVDFTEGTPATKYGKNKTGRVQLDISLKKAAGGQKLLISYLAKGVNWAPSYMLDITEPNKAKLSAKAEIMDEVCDLNDVDVRLVTGFPNLQFADIAGPITMKENLAQFLQSLIRGQSERGQALGVMSNVMVQQQAMAYDRSGMAGEPVMPAYGAAELGKTAEDLFLYPVEKVRLKKGEVGYFPLFTESAPYQHIYRWEIPDYVNPEGGFYDDQSRQRREPEQEVWHCIRLDNVMKLPWTTAPAEIIKDGVILGQDMLNYTPVKEKATVKITRAMNVKAEQIELEKDRKRDAGHWYNYNWDLVTVEGKLSVTNYQEKPIALEITKMLSGEVRALVPDAKLEKLAKSLRAVNPNIKLTWSAELGPGEKKDFTYNYEVYVKR